MRPLLKFIKSFTKNNPFFLLDKRQRFVLQTVILTAGLFVTQLIWEDYRFAFVGILSFVSYLLTIWSLSEDIKGIEWLYLFILPVCFTASVSLFYFLLPGRWITRLTTGVVFAIGTYACLLIENIYNVAAERSIQLLRVAQSVGLLLTLVVVFLSTSIVFSLKTHFWVNMTILIPMSFLLALQSFWAVRLEETLSRQLLSYSAVISVGVGELAAVLSFWPTSPTSAALFITASYYVLVGIIQQHLLDKLFKSTIREYLIAFIFTFLVTLITTSWG